MTQKTLSYSSVELICDGRKERVTGSVMLKGMGRRGLLLSSVLLVSTTAAAATPPLEPESKKALLQSNFISVSKPFFDI